MFKEQSKQSTNPPLNGFSLRRRPERPASILLHCSFAAGCQWQSLNNVNCSNQKVIQFKTRFARVPSQRAFKICRLPLSNALNDARPHKSNVNMQTARLHHPRGTGGGSSMHTASFLPPRNKWPVLSFPCPATTLSHLITCRQWTWQSFASSYDPGWWHT